jgi:plasmid stability protein
MAGTVITLKNVPTALHRTLKESAVRHKRSLNQEAIHILESSLLGRQNRNSSLRHLPQTRSLGKILVSQKDLTSRANDMMDSES